MILILYALHQDIWLWRSARPLFAGFLPVGLTYHAYCFAAALLMWALTTYAWPSHLDPSDQIPLVDSGSHRFRYSVRRFLYRCVPPVARHGT